MIAYGISQAGRSHVERDLPCQDSNCVVPAAEDGTWVAVIADGVGSAPRADVGSRIAAREAASFCAEHLPPDRSLTGTYSMVRTAMNYALKQVLRRAEADGEPSASYDTTLTLAIYDGARVIYGHAGDGGLFALRSDGGLVEVTTPQHGPDGETVIPLSGGYAGWEIGTYPHDVAALLLATDGMRAALRPSLLAMGGTRTTKPHARRAAREKATEQNASGSTAEAAGSSLSDDPAIYAPLARFFADPREGLDVASAEAFLASEPDAAGAYYERLALLLGAEHSVSAAEELARMRVAAMAEQLVGAVRDDRTIAVLANPDAPLAPERFAHYREPDWKALAEAWNKALYPALAQGGATKPTLGHGNRTNVAQAPAGGAFGKPLRRPLERLPRL